MNKMLEGKGLRLLAAAMVVINGFFPAVWILLTSLKTEAELVSRPITYLPHHPVLDNYVRAFTDQPLLKYLGNSFAVAVMSTALSLAVAACAAYAREWQLVGRSVAGGLVGWCFLLSTVYWLLSTLFME